MSHLHQQEVFCPLKEVLDWLETMMARIEFDTFGEERGCEVSLRDYPNIRATAPDFLTAALAVRRIKGDG
jgi:hypothetical protein